MQNHLVVLQHGLHGGSSDFAALSFLLAKTYPSYLVYPARSSESILKTHDGIANAGNRLTQEILGVVRVHPEIRTISLVGHSLGGLIARYAIGALYELNFFDSIKPKYFVSITVPNVGSRRPVRSVWNKVFCGLTHLALQRTGAELLLEDITPEGVPLLVQMAQKGTRYMRGLEMFEYHILYANVQNDISVPYCTAAIVPRNPYLSGQREIKFSPKYPHIIDTGEQQGLSLDLNQTVATQHLEDEISENLFASDKKGEHLRAILKSLQTLRWRKFDVLFNQWIPASVLFSHTNVVMKSKWLNRAGQDVVQHIVDNLVP